MIARPSPSLSLDRDPVSPRPSARRHWRCTLIAVGPTSASSKSGKVTASRSIRAALPTCDACGASGVNRPARRPDADFQRAKSELIRLRIAEKQRHLIPLEEAVGHMDEVVGLFISRLSGFAARCGGRDLAAAARSREATTQHPRSNRVRRRARYAQRKPQRVLCQHSMLVFELFSMDFIPNDPTPKSTNT
jgi:hypothetical protein